ncbi:MAG: GTP-binding protein [Thermomicrobiales bacterium]
MTDPSGLIPIVVVSGFLGSGKTTLLRNLLRDPAVGEAAVIVNEFGEVGIDHHLARKTDTRTTLLRNGCICCSLRDDLAEALRDLISERDRGQISRLDRIIIETTGLADPAPILQTVVADPMLRNHFRVSRVVATLDALGGLTNIEQYGEALRQIAAADHVLVTKQDLATAAAVGALKARVAAINPTATIVDATFGRIDFALLTGNEPMSSVTDLRLQPAPATVHATAGRVESRCFVFTESLNWQMFGIWLTMLLHQYGDRILRMKGLLNIGDGHGPLLLEGVQHVIHAPRHLREWPDEDRHSRIVFIARDLDLNQVAESLTTFQALAAIV